MRTFKGRRLSLVSQLQHTGAMRKAHVVFESFFGLYHPYTRDPANPKPPRTHLLLPLPLNMGILSQRAHAQRLPPPHRLRTPHDPPPLAMDRDRQRGRGAKDHLLHPPHRDVRSLLRAGRLGHPRAGALSSAAPDRRDLGGIELCDVDVPDAYLLQRR